MCVPLAELCHVGDETGLQKKIMSSILKLKVCAKR